MRRALAIAVALVVVAFAVAAHAQSRAAEAKRHLDAGNKLYLDGRYDDAVRELRAGYALDARPDFLYALGQAERKRGDCKAAVRYYQAFVDTGQSPQRTVAVLVQIDRCKQELAAAPATPQTSQSPPAATEPPSPSPSSSSSPSPSATAPARWRVSWQEQLPCRTCWTNSATVVAGSSTRSRHACPNSSQTRSTAVRSKAANASRFTRAIAPRRLAIPGLR